MSTMGRKEGVLTGWTVIYESSSFLHIVIVPPNVRVVLTVLLFSYKSEEFSANEYCPLKPEALS